jgi:uncharacterized membrane protein
MQSTHPLQHRDAGRPVARRRRSAITTRGVNVHHNERLVSALAGGLALAWGLTRRSTLGKAAALAGSGLVYRGVSGHCHMYQAIGVSTADEGSQRTLLPSLRPQPLAHARHFEVFREVTIQKSPAEIQEAWKQPETLARIMGHFAQIAPVKEGVTRWTIHDPLGRSHTWDVELIEDVPGERLRWQSREGSQLIKRGTLDLKAAPGGRGTETRLHLHIERPAGLLGDVLVKVLGPVPGAVAQRALRNLQSLLEAGELPSLEKNPAARPSAAL